MDVSGTSITAEKHKPPAVVVVEEVASSFGARQSGRCVLKMTIDGFDAFVLLDCGATSSFLSESFVAKTNIPTTASAGSVRAFDGSVKQAGCTANVLLCAPQWDETREMAVISIWLYDALLGQDWLYKYNPRINWRRGTVRLGGRKPWRWVSLSEIQTKREQVASVLGGDRPDALVSAPNVPVWPVVSPTVATIVVTPAVSTNALTTPAQQDSSSENQPVAGAEVFLVENWPIASRKQVFRVCEQDAFAVMREAKKSAANAQPTTEPTSENKPLANVSLVLLELVDDRGETREIMSVAGGLIDSPMAKKVFDEFADVFHDSPPLPPRREIEHSIELLPGASPPNVPPYRAGPAANDEISRQLKKLIEDGKIEPSTSSYASPAFLVDKPDGSHRLVVDFRVLNSATVKERYPMPLADELFDRLGNAKVFSKFDITSAFHQIRMKPEDVHKTGFRTRHGHWQWRVLPFGLTNAPATFQRMMHSVLSDLVDKCVVVFVDDILVYSANEQEHLEHVRAVLTRLRKAGLFAKWSKCALFQTEVDFLGFRVSGEGLRPLVSKVASITDWSAPRNRTQLMSFMGLINYYRRFVIGYAHIAPVLTCMFRKGVRWLWSKQMQQAFVTLKERLAKSITITPVIPNRDFVLRVDASDVGIGAVLEQLQADNETTGVCGVFSRQLKTAELNYSAHDRELLAVIAGLEAFDHYVKGRHVVVESDHKPLTYLDTKRKPTARHARWMDRLAEYTYTIKYCPGKRNEAADALSRRPPTMPAVVAAVSRVSLEDERARFKNAYAACKYFGETYGRLVKGEQVAQFSLRDGVLLKRFGEKERVCVPDNEEIRQLVVYDLHDSPTAGHVGTNKTLAAVIDKYVWPGLAEYVRAYVRSCDACQRNKASNLPGAGLLQPLSIPTRAWQSVGLDFVTGLPKTSTGHDALLTVTDRRTKMVHLLPTTKDVDAVTTAKLFFDRVVALHGVPESLVSDRDSKFTGLFWRTLWKRFGVRLMMSTAYHPQTDGQSERTNHTVTDMLRAANSHDQRDWDEHLAEVEFAINNSYQDSIKTTPFELNYGFRPTVPHSLLLPHSPTDVDAVDSFIDSIRLRMQETHDNLVEAQDRQRGRHDAGRRDVQFKPGDKVLIVGSHVQSDYEKERPSRKLGARNTGPFEVVKAVGKNAYELKLPVGARNHPVFNVSRLRRYNENQLPNRLAPPPADPTVDEEGVTEEDWTVEKVLKYRVDDDGTEKWLVKWQNYPVEDNTWEKRACFTRPGEHSCHQWKVFERERKSLAAAAPAGQQTQRSNARYGLRTAPEPNRTAVERKRTEAAAGKERTRNVAAVGGQQAK